MVHCPQMNTSARVAARYLEGTFDVTAMSNLLPRRTGVKGAVIWVSPGEHGGKDIQHGPRVKVVLGEKTTTEGMQDSVSVTISDPPRVLGELPGRIKKQVVRFVALNREVLLAHWRGELDPGDVLERLVRI